MTHGMVAAIFVCPAAGGPMLKVEEAEAITGIGLKGDRYSMGMGSWNKGRQGKRQVTLMNSLFFEGSGFKFAESRRNIITTNVELLAFLGKEFRIGAARFRGVKYCEPCDRPTVLASKKKSFKAAFIDRGGIIAEVIESGPIKTGDSIVPIEPPPKRE